MKSEPTRLRVLARRWKPWVLVGLAGLAWWSYAAPIHLAKRIRTEVEHAHEASAAVLMASRVDFARINAQLSGDLSTATHGKLTGESFSHLLLYGWLPQQRERPKNDDSLENSLQSDPPPGNVAVPSLFTRLYRIRYKELNRFIAIFWDPTQVHEVVLTLQRASVFQRWHVTKVHQFNVCAYDFDCALLSSVEWPPKTDSESRKFPGM